MLLLGSVWIGLWDAETPTVDPRRKCYGGEQQERCCAVTCSGARLTDCFYPSVPGPVLWRRLPPA